MTDHVSDTYKTKVKIIVLNILIFIFFDNKGADRRFWAEWLQAFREVILLWIFLALSFDLLVSFPNYRTLLIFVPMCMESGHPYTQRGEFVDLQLKSCDISPLGLMTVTYGWWIVCGSLEPHNAR